MNAFSSALLLAQEAGPVPSHADDEWSELLFGLQSDHRFVLMIILIGCLTAILIVVTCTISGMMRYKAESRLKQDLLDRGMSAEEIAQIVEATPPTDFLERMAKGKKH